MDYLQNGKMYSVVIPVYNVASYLRLTLDSVIRQTVQDWEAICVDDGSTDGSGVILDEYAAVDDRIKVIHQANAGVSSARNAGIKKANGAWVLFLDADDVWDPCLLEVCGNEIFTHEKLDAIRFNWEEFRSQDWMGSCEREVKEIGGEVIDITVNVPRYIWGGQLWQVCYRRSLIAGLTFREDIKYGMGEDRVFWGEACVRMKKISVVKRALLGYRIRVGSAVHSRKSAIKMVYEFRHYKEMLRLIHDSGRNYSPQTFRSIGVSLTESAARDFWQLPDNERSIAWKAWIEAMLYAKSVPGIWFWARFVMEMCTLVRLRSLAFVMCFIPWWLKKNGIHR